jgi:hypothetical protein
LTLIRVFIATTEGPVAVERITREPAAQSAVCVKRTTRVLPISAAYDAFVRAPSGVIEREFGPWDSSDRLGAFRLDVSAPIGDGESWQSGIFIAHALAAEKRLAGPDDECAEALWITGALDNDLGVGAVGHVAEKLHASADLIEEHRVSGTPLRFFVPEANLKSTTGPGGIDVTGVTTAAEIQRSLNLLDEEAAVPVAQEAAVQADAVSPPQTTGGNGLRTLFTVLGIGILTAGAGAFIYFDQQPVPEKPVVVAQKPTPAPTPVKTVTPAPAAKPKPAKEIAKTPAPSATAFVPTLKVFELRAKNGSSCAAVQFSEAQPVRSLLETAKDDKLPDSRADGLCGLEFVVAVGPEERFVSAAVNLTRGRFVRSRGLPATLKGNTATKGLQRWRAHVPKRLKRPVRYNISVAISKTPITGLATNTQTLTVQHRILP